MLDPRARRSCSAWNLVDQATAAGYVDRLTADLADDIWDTVHGQLRFTRRLTRAAPT